LVAAQCTELSGSSQWFERGFVTYSNEAKVESLGVDPELIETHGAVSEAVARAMAWGALEKSNAQVSLAITGVAGPLGGTPQKPVGCVWFAWGSRSEWPGLGEAVDAQRCIFAGNRAQIRAQAVAHSLNSLLNLLQAH
jgi:nicotinamide-nucleotide amidase